MCERVKVYRKKGYNKIKAIQQNGEKQNKYLLARAFTSIGTTRSLH